MRNRGMKGNKMERITGFVREQKKGCCVLGGGMALYLLLAAAMFVWKGSRMLLLRQLVVGAAVFLLTAAVFYWMRQVKQEKSLVEGFLRYRYRVCLLYFLLFVLLGLHGFSLDLWAGAIPSQGGEATKLFGKSRMVTSDVWAIGIPQMFNQIENGMPLFNETIMSQGMNMVLGGLPALDWTFLGQPHYWGCLLGARMGLAWLYWFKKFALFLSCYEVFHFLVNGRRKPALLGACLITCSPLLNWWFGHTITMVAIYMHWCVACVIGYVNHIGEPKKKIAIAAAGSLGFLGFILGWYPALQVPFGYLALLLVGAVLCRFVKGGGRFGKGDVAVIGMALLCAMLIAARFLWVSRDSIAQLMGTVFPGRRFAVGGGGHLQGIADYLFQPLFALGGPTLSNACEMSSILPFLPTVLLAVPGVLVSCRMAKKRGENDPDPISKGLLGALFLMECFFLSWIFVPWPRWFARYSLMSNVTESRAVWVVSVISVYLGLMALVYFQERGGFGKALALAAALCCSGGLYWIAKDHFDWDFLGSFRIPATMVVCVAFLLFTIFGFFYLSGNQRVTVGMLAALCIATELTINPLEMGVSALAGTELSARIQQIREEEPDALWAAEVSFIFGNYLSAQGVRVLNTTNQYMDSEKWKIFDETGSQEEIYNRYAQEELHLSQDETSLELVSADLIKITLNIRDLKKTGLDYVMTNRDLEREFEADGEDYFAFLYESGNQKIYRVVKQEE